MHKKLTTTPGRTGQVTSTTTSTSSSAQSHSQSRTTMTAATSGRRSPPPLQGPSHGPRHTAPRGTSSSPFIPGVVDEDDANLSDAYQRRHSSPPSAEGGPRPPSARPRLVYDHEVGHRYFAWEAVAWPNATGISHQGPWYNPGILTSNIEVRESVNVVNGGPHRPTAVNSCYHAHTSTSNHLNPRYGAPYGGCCVYASRLPGPMGPPIAHHNVTVPPLAPYSIPPQSPYMHPSPRMQYTPQSYMTPYPRLNVPPCTTPTYSYPGSIPVSQPQSQTVDDHRVIVVGYFPDGYYARVEETTLPTPPINHQMPPPSPRPSSQFNFPPPPAHLNVQPPPAHQPPPTHFTVPPSQARPNGMPTQQQMYVAYPQVQQTQQYGAQPQAKYIINYLAPPGDHQMILNIVEEESEEDDSDTEEEVEEGYKEQ